MKIAYRKNWGHCYVVVFDVGEHSFWGSLRDREDSTWTPSEESFQLDQMWIFEEIPDLIFSNLN